MKCVHCGEECQHFPVLDEILFPVGRVITDHPCDYCERCQTTMPDNALFTMRKYNYNLKMNHLLIKNGLDYGSHPELYVGEEEFERMTRLIITKNLKDWLEKGFFCKRIEGKLHFLKQAVDHYNMTDNGMFLLIPKEELERLRSDKSIIEAEYCTWCHIGTMTYNPHEEHWKCSYCRREQI